MFFCLLGVCRRTNELMLCNVSGVQDISKYVCTMTTQDVSNTDTKLLAICKFNCPFQGVLCQL